MKETGKHIVTHFQKRWQLLLVLEALLYTMGVAFLVFVIGKHWGVTLSFFLILLFVLLVIKKPWKVSTHKVSQYLDENLESLEYSTGLLLTPKNELSDIAQLQCATIEKQLRTDVGKMQPRVLLKRALFVCCALVALAFLLHYFKVFEGPTNTYLNNTSQEQIVFQALDTNAQASISPNINQQRLTIKYPVYTKVPSKTTSSMNVKVLEGSQAYWNIEFDKEVDSVFFEKEATLTALKQNKNKYILSRRLNESFFYNFKFISKEGDFYASDLYAIEVIKDEAPIIEIKGLKQFTSFDITDTKQLKFQTNISDDFGIANTYIIATVTKGEGESVKFREERLLFDAAWTKGAKQLKLNKTINLEALKMEAGDELYFYVEGIDTKQPKANRSRSETYFAVIRDTVTNQFAVEGTMGADLMPDYFRSQRQLIIDTEKLIANKNKISKSDFNSTSNELGYDQKALRLKYGEFMGDEADSGIQVTQTPEIEESQENNEDDPLQQYTHDHDGSNEHNLVDHDHEEKSLAEEKEDPLEAYVHNHEDPEASTLFAQSLKSKLRSAMAEMWDAELNLRLYTPAKSLPYQYRALKLIQEIKNSARIYVHRIGFDPPPIKEEKRLSGDLDEINTYQRTKETARSDAFTAMRQSVTRITEILEEKRIANDTDRMLFKEAGNELATLAIENPGNYLELLQELKWLSDRKQNTHAALVSAQQGLLKAVPPLDANPSKENVYESELTRLMLKELDRDE